MFNMFAGQGDVEYVYINQSTGEYKVGQYSYKVIIIIIMRLLDTPNWLIVGHK